MKKKFFLVTLFSGALLLLFIRFRSEMPDREKVASAQDSEEAVQLLRILDKAWNEGSVPVRAHIRETENGKKLIRLED